MQQNDRLSILFVELMRARMPHQILAIALLSVKNLTVSSPLASEAQKRSEFYTRGILWEWKKLPLNFYFYSYDISVSQGEDIKWFALKNFFPLHRQCHCYF